MKYRIDHRRWTRHDTRVANARRSAPTDLYDVVRRTALTIRTDWAAQWAPSRHLPHLGAAITFDTGASGAVFTAEIGPDKLRRQGPLGHLIEDANGRARNRATHAGNRAGRRAEAGFERRVADVAEDGVGG